MPPTIAFDRSFAVALPGGDTSQVRVNLVTDGGRRWVNAERCRTFGLASSAWTGRDGRRRRAGMRRRTELQLLAARQHPVDGQPPEVVVSFAGVVSREVAEALTALGAHVEGQIVDVSTTGPALPASAALPLEHVLGPPQGRHVLWWPAAQEREGHGLLRRLPGRRDQRPWRDGAGRHAIGAAYRALNGLEPFALAALLRTCGLIGNHLAQVALPEAPLYLRVRLPGSAPLVLSAAADKGLRLHFDPQRTSAAERDDTWGRFAQAAAAWATALRADPSVTAQRTPSGATSPLEWWERVDELAVASEDRDGQAPELGVILP